MAKFKELYNADLANGLGNLVARIMQLAQTNLIKGTKPESTDFPSEFTDALDAYHYNDALEIVWKRIQALDQMITETAPFKVVKTDPDAGKGLIFNLTQELYAIGLMLEPFMPETSEKIKAAIIDNKKPDNLFLRRE